MNLVEIDQLAILAFVPKHLMLAGRQKAGGQYIDLEVAPDGFMQQTLSLCAMRNVFPRRKILLRKPLGGMLDGLPPMPAETALGDRMLQMLDAHACEHRRVAAVGNGTNHPHSVDNGGGKDNG